MTETIGQQLARLRKAQGLTQAQLADRVGTSETYIGHWETGYRRPSYPMRKALARALGVTLADLDPELTAQPDAPSAAPVAGAA